MANKSRFLVAETKIKAFFNNGVKVYTLPRLSGILEENRIIWNLPISMNGDKFAERLVNSGILIHKEIILAGKKDRYLTADASEFDVAASMVNKCYLSHYTAVFLHGLTNQLPKTIYISFEQSKKINVERILTQEAVDGAFAKPQRQSGTVSPYGDFKLVLLNGMYTNRTGITSIDNLPVTNLERTLIDIAVRPNYAGGVDSVLNAYRRAIDRISVNKLIAILDKMNFVYPYHQSIGFYLEKAGLDETRLRAFKAHKQELNFYLTYELKDKEYSDAWKLYYPKGM